MCGISGIFSSRPLEPGASLDAMRQALAHRGPDGSGEKLFRHAALLHNRLAIIDLDGGAQPLSSADGLLNVVFNGEIYNYRELRATLKDYPFSTQSDTEVIIALYAAEGIEGWRRLRGMYAFAFWDQRLEQGILLRDPVGIKPLFYAVTEDKLVFASEAKAIIAQGHAARLDPSTLHQVFNFRYVTGEASLFQGIRQLAPGGMAVWQSGRTAFSTLTPLPKPAHGTLGERFTAAVESHLVADVSLGCFLSGGLDSALVAKLAARRVPLSSYTLDAGDDPLEADNARATAQWLNIPNHRQALALNDPISLHRQLAWHLETPKVNALQGAMLAEFTARHVKVALSGLGGDELFYGYNAHQLMWLAGFARRILPCGANRGIAALLTKALPTSSPLWSERERALAMLGALPDWARVYGLLRNVWDAPTLRQTIYGERMLDESLPDSYQWLADSFPAHEDPVVAMARFELKNKLVNDLLWQEDRISMRVGLETRVPFLDWDLLQWAQGHSRGQLMPWGRKKHTLKRYAATELPATVLQRKKSGFQLDIVTLAQGVLKPVFEEYLSDERLLRHRLFNPQFVQNVRRLRPHKSLRWHYFLLYLMAQSHIFLEEFHVG